MAHFRLMRLVVPAAAVIALAAGAAFWWQRGAAPSPQEQWAMVSRYSLPQRRGARGRSLVGGRRALRRPCARGSLGESRSQAAWRVDAAAGRAAVGTCCRPPTTDR